MNKIVTRFRSMILAFTEEPNVERISQPESSYLIKKRLAAEEYLRSRSPKWRDKERARPAGEKSCA